MHHGSPLYPLALVHWKFSSCREIHNFLSIQKKPRRNPQGNMEQNYRKVKKDDTTVGRSEILKFA